MSSMKDFLELVSKDANVKLELAEASFKALTELLAEKGFSEDAAKAMKTAAEKVAEAHGFKSSEMEELSKEELEAIAGGDVIRICTNATSLIPGIGPGMGGCSDRISTVPGQDCATMLMQQN